MASTICLVFSFVLAALATFGIESYKIQLFAAAFAFFIASLLVAKF